jgi:hypothetical protein
MILVRLLKLFGIDVPARIAELQARFEQRVEAAKVRPNLSTVRSPAGPSWKYGAVAATFRRLGTRTSSGSGVPKGRKMP